MTDQADSRSRVKALAICGPIAAAAVLAADLAGIRATPGYSPVSQAISELMERGAPAKPVVDPLLLIYHGLVIPFALGLQRGLPVGGIGPLLIGFAGMAGVILTLFFPCDPGCEPFVSLPGTLHIFIAIPMGFSILLGIWLTAARMRGYPAIAGYSRVTAVLGLVLAVLTVALAETELVGIAERVLTWSYLQWYAVMGLMIWRWTRPRK